MNFYTQQHKYYCGIDLRARKMYVCVLHQQGNDSSGQIKSQKESGLLSRHTKTHTF